MREPLKALSVTPCWAHAIIHLGKGIENRTWQRAYRGPLLIHAGKKFDEEELENIRTRAFEHGMRLPTKDEITIGGIIGILNFVDVVEESDDPWFNGPIGWVFKTRRKLPFLPLKGQLGIFNVNPPLAWLRKAKLA